MDRIYKTFKINYYRCKNKATKFSLKKFKTLPSYKIISNTGPRHKPKIKVAVKLKILNLLMQTAHLKNMPNNCS